MSSKTCVEYTYCRENSDDTFPDPHATSQPEGSKLQFKDNTTPAGTHTNLDGVANTFRADSTLTQSDKVM